MMQKKNAQAFNLDVFELLVDPIAARRLQDDIRIT